MSEGSKDLFGKIDALFEKRAPDALVDKGLEYEDFPVLTEVIGSAPAAPRARSPRSGWPASRSCRSSASASACRWR